jgi:hypothetical protein
MGAGAPTPAAPMSETVGRPRASASAGVIPARSGRPAPASPAPASVGYFKVSDRPLEPGTVLRGYDPDPGYLHMVRRALANGLPQLETLLHADWLDAVRAGQPGRPALTLSLIEVLFELERAAHFPARPPRLGSVHLFRSPAAAGAFARRYRRGPVYLYRCAVEDGAPFDTYMDWVNQPFDIMADLAQQLEAQGQRARDYWCAARPPGALYPETLVRGRVVVVAAAPPVQTAEAVRAGPSRAPSGSGGAASELPRP